MNGMNLTKASQGWKRTSPRRYVHESGFRIEERGGPGTVAGWYLVAADRSVPPRRFSPTPQGLGEALAAFACHRAVLEELARILAAD